jgi:hypothetical protein
LLNDKSVPVGNLAQTIELKKLGKMNISMEICLHNINDSNSSCSNISDMMADKCGEELSGEDWETILIYR